MSHSNQIEYIKLIKYLCIGRLSDILILEVGSYDVNGTIRNIFCSCNKYIGADLVKGPNVDIVQSGHRLSFNDSYFDITISCECFEHNPFWKETFHNMIRMTKDGGLVIVTCASTGRIEHGTHRTSPESSPGTQATGLNYYRNLTERDFLKSTELGKLFGDWIFFKKRASFDLYFIGIKGEKYTIPNRNQLLKKVRSIGKLSEVGYSFTNLSLLSIRWIYYLPLNILSAILPDSYYQEIAVRYSGIARLLRSYLRRATIQR